MRAEDVIREAMECGPWTLTKVGAWAHPVLRNSNGDCPIQAVARHRGMTGYRLETGESCEFLGLRHEEASMIIAEADAHLGLKLLKPLLNPQEILPPAPVSPVEESEESVEEVVGVPV